MSGARVVSELGPSESGSVWRANDIGWLHYKFDTTLGRWITGTNPNPDLPMWGGTAYAPDGIVRRSAGFTEVRPSPVCGVGYPNKEPEKQ